MKRKKLNFKTILLIVSIIFIFPITAGAEDIDSEIYAPDLIFEPVGGGKYIYCNNAEAVFGDKLANGDAPSYIMNNENCGPDMYYLYISHFNFVNYGSGRPGFDAELDVELTARKDSSFKVLRTGFDSPYPYYALKNQTWIRSENVWEDLQACADMWGDLHYIDGSSSYYYHAPNETVGLNEVINLKQGETVWLSQFIRNYRATPYIKPVHMQGLLEILSGSMDINVCMFKSGDVLGDRSGFDASKLTFGGYQRDRTQKGVADSLPQVKAELSYIIDDDIEDGTLLPVTVKNQYVPEGAAVTKWCTHLNPQDDIWSKNITAENDILALRYKDDGKLNFYGKNVPPEKKDNVWRFDPFHSDTRQWTADMDGSEDDYIPNYPLSVDEDNQGYGCSIGNYGVYTTYHIKVTNDGDKTRYFEYIAETASNLIVYTGSDNDILTEKNHISYCKGMSDSAKPDVMSEVELPPHKTTDVYISVNLPVNTYGGIKNSFKISDTNEFAPVKSNSMSEFEGNDYPLLSQADLPDETGIRFEGNLRNFELIPLEKGYIVRPCSWDGAPNLAYNVLEYASTVYTLDADKNIIGDYTFLSPTIDGFWEGAAYGSRVYINTAGNGWYSTRDGLTWTAVESVYDRFNPGVTALKNAIGDFDVLSIEDENGIRINLPEQKLTEITTVLRNIPILTSVASRSGEVIVNKGRSFVLKRKTGEEIKLYLSGEITVGRNKYRAGLSGKDFLTNYYLSYYCNYDLNPNAQRPSDWAASTILSAYEAGLAPPEIMINNANSQGYLKSGITRGDFAKLAYRFISMRHTLSSDLNDYGYITFSDTQDEAPKRLSAINIVNGYEDGSFRPENQITREEAATILWRMAAFMRLTESDEEYPYKDLEQVSDWARQAVSKLNRLGVMEGVGSNIFAPSELYTVEQSIATMLRLYLKATNNFPTFPIPNRGQKYCVIYKEGYRNNRIEIAFFNGEGDIENNEGVLTCQGYRDDEKYYLSCGQWIKFEENAPTASNNGIRIIRR